MNDGTLQRVTMNPLNAPHASPVMRQRMHATHSGAFISMIAKPRTAPLSAMTEPTDRSMPAMINTNVMPTAMTVSDGI